jgi:toxin ParE1/3/4
MRRYEVIIEPAAQGDLEGILHYVIDEAGVAVALAFVDRLEAACFALEHAPERGSRRDDLAPGLRTVGVERRASLLFHVDVEKGRVFIHAVLYGGRDVDAIARSRLSKEDDAGDADDEA